MKNFADVKKRFIIGTELKLIRHDWLKPNSPLQLGDIRTIIKVQSNAIQFNTGSWLHYPKSCDIVTNGENEFSVVLSTQNAEFMTYEFI